jgi:uncharacterized protein
MSSTKSLIECLQDDVKHYDEELHREFAKQVKDPRKQEELLNKRRKCVDEIRNEWDKQEKENLSDEEYLSEAINNLMSKYKNQIAKLEKKVAKLERALEAKK